jgi:hypothetical protein
VTIINRIATTILVIPDFDDKKYTFNLFYEVMIVFFLRLQCIKDFLNLHIVFYNISSTLGLNLPWIETCRDRVKVGKLKTQKERLYC